MLISVAIFVLQTTIVIRSCTLFLSNRVYQNRVLFSTLEDSGLDSLRILIVALIIKTIIVLFRVVYCAMWDQEPLVNVFIAAMQLSLAGFITLSVMRHVLVSENVNELARKTLFESDNKAVSEVADKYGHSLLSDQRHKEVLRKIHAALNQQHIYKQAGLNLSELCTEINEKAHIVSQVINRSDLKNFYDMINSRRVALAEQELLSNDETSILDLALNCGFNSKSSFNSVFKRYTGLSPSQYRARNAEALNKPQ